MRIYANVIVTALAAGSSLYLFGCKKQSEEQSASDDDVVVVRGKAYRGKQGRLVPGTDRFRDERAHLVELYGEDYVKQAWDPVFDQSQNCNSGTGPSSQD